jgi:chemotaxis protein methyltransferase CheR
MNEPEFVAFLQWALPQRGLRWPGFRNVRGTVRKRLAGRLAELGLKTLSEYREHLQTDPAEWFTFERMCRIPISRFYRDHAVFEVLATVILPERAREGRTVRVWSAGCASGEEPYTIAILWDLEIAANTPIEIVATDAEEHMIERARRGCYPGGSVRELPERLRGRAFRREEQLFCVRDEHRGAISFRCEDLLRTMPDGPFDIILCRNLAFTYFDEPTQRVIAAGMIARLQPGGALVIGAHETLPPGVELEERAHSVFVTSSRGAK